MCLSSYLSVIVYARIFALCLGLCTDECSVNSKIVLAGDSQQLEAVVKSQIAQDNGYAKSFIEYLIEHPLFNLENSPSSCVVQLTKNYRSHPAIIQTPSRLFYRNSLEASAGTGLLSTSVFFLLYMKSRIGSR